MAFFVAGLYNPCGQLKPFNPILGETYEATWPDGSELFLEHTSHHPPISHFLAIDVQKKWKYWGYYEYQAKLRGNSVIGKQEGPNNVGFPDGTVIKFNCPAVRVSGFLYGDRICELFGSIRFEDKKNDMQLEISFTEPSGFFSSASHPTDWFSYFLQLNDSYLPLVVTSRRFLTPSISMAHAKAHLSISLSLMV